MGIEALRTLVGFVNPIQPQVRDFRRESKKVCVRCGLVRGGTGRRRQLRAVNGGPWTHLDAKLPPQFLTCVRRLVRSRAFVEDVKQAVGWPLVRFTGIVFQRLAVTDENPDGVPDSVEEFRKKVDYSFVDVPPGVLSRAAQESGFSGDTGHMHICAIFETYGVDRDEVAAAQEERRKSEEDLDKQLLAWSDVGQSMRTETDVLNVSGPELFHESFIDFLE